jgi:uncharacterized protein YjbI with pentapeptide repeats
MANSEQLEILRQGAAVWNAWRKTVDRSTIDLSECDFNGFDLTHVNLSRIKLSKANFAGSNIFKTRFAESTLDHANFSGMTIVGGGYFAEADLSEANFSFADLSTESDDVMSATQFHFANLSGANFEGAKLNKAVFFKAELSGTNFKSSNLTGADFGDARIIHADLSGADLTDTRLGYTRFIRSNLDGSDFTRATVARTIFAESDLSNCVNLTSAVYKAPCTIGIDTFYASKGKIPEAFLRGCGVPDGLINLAKSLVGAEEGIQFYSCFISYSGLDEEFARHLHGRLQQEHVRVWFSPHDIQGGKKLHEQIDEAIRIYDKLLILLSPHSLKSEWVITELRKARKAERKTGKRKLFPLRLVDFQAITDWECFDSDSGQDLAVEVREYFIPDFSNWKDHDAFEAGFARLLKDLRANETAKT